MTCENAAKMVMVRLKTPWHRPGLPPVIAYLQPERRLLVARVRWGQKGGRPGNYFWDCGSWTFDMDTFTHYRNGFDLMHFHLKEPQEASNRPLIYAIAADTFISAGHSSYSCQEKDRALAHAERWHCPRENWQYDHELEKAYPPPEAAAQPALF